MINLLSCDNSKTHTQSILVNGISQEKEKDFPIVWEVFLGEGYGNLNRTEGCHIQLLI